MITIMKIMITLVIAIVPIRLKLKNNKYALVTIYEYANLDSFLYIHICVYIYTYTHSTYLNTKQQIYRYNITIEVGIIYSRTTIHKELSFLNVVFHLGWEVPLASGLQPSPRSWLGLFALSSQWVLRSAWLELPSDNDNKDFLVPVYVKHQTK